MSVLVIQVRLHDHRYHGEGDWPPSPARLFQALVAGAGLSGPLNGEDVQVLEWLESLDSPIVAAPRGWQPRRSVRVYVPNNDGDRIGGDPDRIAEIRSDTKVFGLRLLDPTVPIFYAWPLGLAPTERDFPRQACALAERLYQLGRGIDMAWAWGEVLSDEEFQRLLCAYEGQVLLPSPAHGGIALQVPAPGSLESLLERHRDFGRRFALVCQGRSVNASFRKPARPKFRTASYDSPQSRYLYELCAPGAQAVPFHWPLSSAHALVVALRDRAVERLRRALPGRAADIARVLIGRQPDDSIDSRPGDRVRIVPLPSVGHQHADYAIRRVLVEVPPGCPMRPDDARWAFSGLEIGDEEPDAVLVPAGDERFLRHFGIGDSNGSCVWRTVTPAALPESARRRRIDPARLADEVKRGSERGDEHSRAASAVCQALRHAGVRGRVASVRLQREPFHRNGDRVEAFAAGTRFDKHRLWHVEVRFIHPVQGPLVIGDGRYLGLGVMAPVTGARDLHVFEIVSGLGDLADPGEVARALRRAVMARAQLALGTRSLPGYFSGHAADGTPAQSSELPHLAFAFEPTTARVAIIAPYLLDRREASREEREQQATLDRALEDFVELRAGPAGCLTLRPVPVDAEHDDLTRPSREWWSATPYVVTRHARLGDAAAAIEANLRDECRRCGLPEPSQVDVCVETRAGRPLAGRATLRFQTAVRGPIALGRTRFSGGGLFVARAAGATG